MPGTHPNRPSMALPGLVLVAAALSILAILNVARWPPAKHVPPPDNRPIQDPAPEFVTSDQCRSCHPREHATWHDSWHRTMTQVATPETVIPDMNGITLAHRDQTHRVDQVGREF